MQMGVGLAGALPMNVMMRTNELGAFQQGYIVKHGERRAFTGHGAVFEHIAAVGNIFQGVEVVSCRNHGFRAVAPGDQKIDDLGLAAGIERRAGLEFLALEDPASIDAALEATREGSHAGE